MASKGNFDPVFCFITATPLLYLTMSRHKLVKNLDLDEVLDDYDGALDENVDEDLAPEDRGKRRVSHSTIKALIRARTTA